MKTKTFLTTLIIGVICQFAPQICRAQDVNSMAPVIVKTIPEAGSKDVSPGVMEIKVTFSKEMMDQSWSWSSAWKNSDPESVGKPKYEADQKTCVLKVKLEPNKTYGYWINSQNFHGFKDQQGHSAVPYLLVFQTKPASTDPRLETKVSYATEKASVQDIVRSLAEQAGLQYDFQKSFAQTDPVCRRWVEGVAIRDKSCRDALEEILGPVGLRYQVENGTIVLYRK